MGCLQDKVIIITGAGRGIGRAEALALAREGARLVLDDMGCDVAGRGSDPRVVQGLADELRADGHDVVATDRDVRTPDIAAHLLERTLDRFGRVDGLLCNAGVLRERASARLDDQDFAEVFDVQAGSTFRLAPAVMQQMINQGSGGSLLFTISPAGVFGAARQAHLAAAGGAVVGFARSVAIDGRRHGIRANVISPLARTRATEALPMFRGIRPESLTPAQVAVVATFLLSPLAQDISGEVFGVAGNRLYTLQARETAGIFAEGEAFGLQELAARWSDATHC